MYTSYPAIVLAMAAAVLSSRTQLSSRQATADFTCVTQEAALCCTDSTFEDCINRE